MEVEVGKYYIDGNRDVRYIEDFIEGHKWHYMSIEGRSYTKSGVFTIDLSDSKDNLVEEISKEENPEYFF